MTFRQGPATLISVISMAAALTLPPIPASAHDPGLSSAVIRLGDGEATALIVVAARDLAALVPYDEDGDRSLSATELRSSEIALEELAALSERQARVVELRFFGGLDVAQVAELLEISDRTVKTDWRMARAWLRRKLVDRDDDA